MQRPRDGPELEGPLNPVSWHHTRSREIYRDDVGSQNVPPGRFLGSAIADEREFGQANCELYRIHANQFIRGGAVPPDRLAFIVATRGGSRLAIGRRALLGGSRRQRATRPACLAQGLSLRRFQRSHRRLALREGPQRHCAPEIGACAAGGDRGDDHAHVGEGQ